MAKTVRSCASIRPACAVQIITPVPGCAPPFEQPGAGRLRHGSGRSRAPGGIELDETRPAYLRAEEPPSSLATWLATVSVPVISALEQDCAPPESASSPRSFRASAPAASPPPAWPSRGRSRSPASRNALRVCLPGYDPSLLERIHRPESKELCPPSSLPEPV